MKKLISFILALTLMLASAAALASCSIGTNDDTTTTPSEGTTTQGEVTTEPAPTPDDSPVSVTVLKGPTGMGAAKLIYDYNKNGGDVNYSFNVSSSPDEVRAALMNGTTDIAAVPTNLAAVLYNKLGGQVEVLALNTLGVLYMLENGNTINSVEDLRGKTIYATGQGSTPEYILRFILSENGIDPDKDVEIIYYTEHSELATLMTAGTVVLGMLPEPNVSTVLAKNSNVRIALNLTEEWEKVVSDRSAVVQGCNFGLGQVAAADNTDDAAEIIAELGIIPSAAVAAAALPNSNIVCVTGSDMKTMLHPFLKVLFNASAASVGGAMPGDDFYYTPQD